ncbi:MAG: TIGR02584 family CRISPR-associated protein [Verrucomicrobiae bacterium]|nr:TIGR02584 family CRISPR-associated protein [Verrucomicrobiae bacterium]
MTPPDATHSADSPTATATGTAPSAPGTSIIAPDTVLLAVTGMSPAVLTETVWALAHQPEPVIPARIVVVTTALGRTRIERDLFGPSPRFKGQTPWLTLRDALADAGHPVEGRLRFGTTSDDIRVITAVDPATGCSRELADIRTPSDNEAAADFLLGQVRQFVENADIHLIASVAGGRKTMGALLYACLTLAGRETDRLTHVLVNEPFETTPDFFFPAQPGGPLSSRDNRPLDPATAVIELADVPFVPLRNLFTRELGRNAGTFSRLIDNCREEVRKAAGQNVGLTIYRERRLIDIQGTRVELAPQEHLLLLCLATRRNQGEPTLDSFADAVRAVDDFRRDLAQTAPLNDFSDWRHSTAVNEAFDTDQKIRRAVSSIRRKLQSAGGNAYLLAPALPQKGRFSLEIEPALICIL